ncbi:uncharacterized protein B0T15DRAFT_376043, partial [Chaetomium strumarium]
GYTQDEWPLEDECRTVALLEKIKRAMADAGAHPDRPIGPMRKPKTAGDVVANLRSFSDEARRSPPSTDSTPPPDDSIPLPPFPPLPACYGWTAVPRDETPYLNPPVSDLVDWEVDWHWAIVYELVPGAPQDIQVGQAHLDFFYAVGFAMEAYKPDNWRGGRLVDFNDVCSPFTIGWTRTAVVPRDAQTWFWTLDFRNDRGIRHTIV